MAFGGANCRRFDLDLSDPRRGFELMTLGPGDLSRGVARHRRVAGDVVSLELLGAPELHHLHALLLFLLLLLLLLLPLDLLAHKGQWLLVRPLCHELPNGKGQLLHIDGAQNTMHASNGFANLLFARFQMRPRFLYSYKFLQPSPNFGLNLVTAYVYLFHTKDAHSLLFTSNW